jgi:hypothetical protein
MPKVDPTQGLVIIYRPSVFEDLGGGGNRIKLLCDGKPLPALRNGEFMYLYLPPGDHTLYSDKKKRSDSRIVRIEAGEVKFIVAHTVTGWTKMTVDLLEVDPETAKKKITRMQHR